MTPSKYLLILIIVFIWSSVLLSVFSVVDISFTEIITYTFISLGVTLFYPSFNRNYSPGIFLGSSFFFTGIIFFVSNQYELLNTAQFLLPSLLLVIAFSLLMIFIAKPSDTKFLYVALLLCSIGIYTLLERGNPAVGTFINALKNLFGRFWIMILLVAAVIMVLKFEKKENQQ